MFKFAAELKYLPAADGSCSAAPLPGRGGWCVPCRVRAWPPPAQCTAAPVLPHPPCTVRQVIILQSYKVLCFCYFNYMSSLTDLPARTSPSSPTSLARMSRIPPILYGSLARLSANSNFRLSREQPGQGED